MPGRSLAAQEPRHRDAACSRRSSSRWSVAKLARERSEARASQVGSGDRSEKIRTYNYKEGRVTDHRIRLTLHKLPEVLQGDLDAIVEALKQSEIEERLKAL